MRLRLSVCVSDFIVGSNMSFPSSVSVLCITQQPKGQVLSEGDALHLECSAQANPPPQFQWYHNQQPLLNATRHFIKVCMYLRGGFRKVETRQQMLALCCQLLPYLESFWYPLCIYLFISCYGTSLKRVASWYYLGYIIKDKTFCVCQSTATIINSFISTWFGTESYCDIQ